MSVRNGAPSPGTAVVLAGGLAIMLAHAVRQGTTIAGETRRARELAQGHEPRIESRNKPTVTALREVAQGLTGLEMLRKVPT